MKPSLRFAFCLVVLLFGVFPGCHSDHSAPTQPVVISTPTPGAGPTPTPAAMAHVVNVGQGGNVFVDSTSGNNTTSIRAGQTVMWVWVSGPHSTTSGVCCNPDGMWDSGIQSSGSFSRAFPTAGSFPYFCMVHNAMMTGMVVVSP